MTESRGASRLAAAPACFALSPPLPACRRPPSIMRAARVSRGSVLSVLSRAVVGVGRETGLPALTYSRRRPPPPSLLLLLPPASCQQHRHRPDPDSLPATGTSLLVLSQVVPARAVERARLGSRDSPHEAARPFQSPPLLPLSSFPCARSSAAACDHQRRRTVVPPSARVHRRPSRAGPCYRPPSARQRRRSLRGRSSPHRRRSTRQRPRAR